MVSELSPNGPPTSEEIVEDLRNHFLAGISDDFDILALKTIYSLFQTACLSKSKYGSLSELIKMWSSSDSRVENLILEELERLVDGNSDLNRTDPLLTRHTFIVTFLSLWKPAFVAFKDIDPSNPNFSSKLGPFTVRALSQNREESIWMFKCQILESTRTKFVNKKMDEELEEGKEANWEKVKTKKADEIVELIKEKILIVQSSSRLEAFKKHFMNYFNAVDFKELVILHYAEFVQNDDLDAAQMKDSRSMISQLLLNVELLKNTGILQLPQYILHPGHYDAACLSFSH